MKLSDGGQNAATDAIIARVNQGTGPGKIRIWDDASYTTLLAELVLSDPAYTASGVQGAAGAGLQAATVGKAWIDVSTATVEDATPGNAGTAAHGAIVDSDNNIEQEGTVGVTSSGEFIELNSLTIQTTVPVQCTNGFLQTVKGVV